MAQPTVVDTRHLGEQRYRDLKVAYEKKSINYWNYETKPTGIYFTSQVYTKSEGIRSWSTGQKGDGYLCVEELDRYRPSVLKAVIARVNEHADQIHDLLDNPTQQNLATLKAYLRGETVDANATHQSGIAVFYSSVDGFSEAKLFHHADDARAFAVHWIGAHPEIGGSYAVSPDGVGRIQVSGLTITDLFARAAAA